MSWLTKDWTVGELNALVKILGDENARGILSGTVRFVAKASEFLRHITTVLVNATKHFVAEDHVKSANIGWMGDSFKRVMLGKVEHDVRACGLDVHEFKQPSLDAPILAELAERAEVTLAHFFELLKKQKDGQTGALLTNGYANIAYILDMDGNLWAVDARWDGFRRDWFVEAFSVEDPYGWHAGRRVLSRK